MNINNFLPFVQVIIFKPTSSCMGSETPSICSTFFQRFLVLNLKQVFLFQLFLVISVYSVLSYLSFILLSIFLSNYFLISLFFLIILDFLDLVRPFLGLVRPRVVFIVFLFHLFIDPVSLFTDTRLIYLLSLFLSNSSSPSLSIPPELSYPKICVLLINTTL